VIVDQPDTSLMLVQIKCMIKSAPREFRLSDDNATPCMQLRTPKINFWLEAIRLSTKA